MGRKHHITTPQLNEKADLIEYMKTTISDIMIALPETTLGYQDLHRCATDLTICKKRLYGINKKTNN